MKLRFVLQAASGVGLNVLLVLLLCAACTLEFSFELSLACMLDVCPDCTCFVTAVGRGAFRCLSQEIGKLFIDICCSYIVYLIPDCLSPSPQLHRHLLFACAVDVDGRVLNRHLRDCGILRHTQLRCRREGGSGTFPTQLSPERLHFPEQKKSRRGKSDDIEWSHVSGFLNAAP
jgi:hypothetical protein